MMAVPHFEPSEPPLPQHVHATLLRRVPVLAKLPDSALGRIACDCKWLQYELGQQILAYQDPSTDVFFLISGRARVVIYASSGKNVVFTDLRCGAMFGEIAAIDRGSRSATVEALEPCMIAALSADQFERLMLDEPTVALATLRQVTVEVRRLSERVLEFSTLLVRSRIHAELVRLASDAGQGKGEVLLQPAPSLSELAARIATRREAVSRELSRLSALGLVRREGVDLRIIDIARLNELVRDAKGE